MRIVLNSDVKKLGYRGDVVKVKNGYFRNFLSDKYETSVEVYYKGMNNLIEYKEGALPQDVSDVVTVNGEELVVDEPKEGALLAGETVMVQGKAGARAVSVRVNGYIAEVTNGLFQKEIALPDEEEFSIEVQAEDKDGLIIGTKSIALRRDIKPPEPPTITAPAAITIGDMVDTLEPVLVSDEEFEITGTASDDAVGIIVNGYRLQKYQL